mmetsp:Transcript_87302/g.252112  ORF Transcript_87302/g.252112 Transcript_87302/m.252112 type:complete len:317 (+) Transcript_87302:1-951(+)
MVRRILALLLFLPPGGGANRMVVGPPPGRELVRRSAPRSGIAALLFIGMVGPAGAQMDPTTKEHFEVIDTDCNGRISRSEYYAATQGFMPLETVPNFDMVFAQADVDDDSYLDGAEYEFSRYLVGSDTMNYEEHVGDVLNQLPPGLKENLDNRLWELGKKGRKVSLEMAVKELLPTFREIGMGESQTEHVVSKLFNHANIIPDEGLNLNELDYFHFIARDVILGLALHSIDDLLSEEGERSLVVDLIKMWDRDKDNRLNAGELLDGLMSYTFQTESRADMSKAVDLAFGMSDIDADGSLDSSEMITFLDAMAGTAP